MAKPKRPTPKLTTAALIVNAKIRATGVLPKPRVEVRAAGKGFHARLIDAHRHIGDWGESFTLRNNCRRAARKAHPGVPVVSR